MLLLSSRSINFYFQKQPQYVIRKPQPLRYISQGLEHSISPNQPPKSIIQNYTPTTIAVSSGEEETIEEKPPTKYVQTLPASIYSDYKPYHYLTAPVTEETPKIPHGYEEQIEIRPKYVTKLKPYIPKVPQRLTLIKPHTFLQPQLPYHNQNHHQYLQEVSRY